MPDIKQKRIRVSTRVQFCSTERDTLGGKTAKLRQGRSHPGQNINGTQHFKRVLHGQKRHACTARRRDPRTVPRPWFGPLLRSHSGLEATSWSNIVAVAYHREIEVSYCLCVYVLLSWGLRFAFIFKVSKIPLLYTGISDPVSAS